MMSEPRTLAQSRVGETGLRAFLMGTVRRDVPAVSNADKNGGERMAIHERDIAFDKAANLTETVYEHLRSEIVRGQLRPNERLVEAELAERLQVSRTPVREGLQRLAADGLVISRRRGWVVYEHTIDQIRDIYETRMALEGYATRLAAERATPQQVLALDAIPRASAGTLPAPREHLVGVNARFHDAIVDASGNRQ